MTLTNKNSSETNGPGKPGASSQNSENNPGQSPRSSPVCLEVGVTLRSLPTEAGGPAKPIREEGRTVIVFENGAVLRSASNLPVGQTVILSNPKGRDVVCRVIGGRNLPTVKGYVEVEFIEPVKDFWGIHQDVNSAAVAAPHVAPLASREAPVPPAAPSRAAAPLESPAKPASVSLGNGPTFEDVAGLMSMAPSAASREAKPYSTRPGPEKMGKDDSDYNLSAIAESTSVANWRPPDSEPSAEKRSNAATREAMPISSPAASSTPPHDFMSKGLMAYEQPRPAFSPSNGRKSLIVGGAALLLVGLGAGLFQMHRSSGPVSVAKTEVVTQPSMPEPEQLAANAAPEPVQAPQEDAAQLAATAQTQPVAIDRSQTAAAVAPVPAVVTGTETTDTGTESSNIRRQEKNAVVSKRPDVSSSRRPAIPNLKMASPSAPNRNSANLGVGASPITDIGATEVVGGTTPAGLLTSAGRTSNPPAPPSAPASSLPVVPAIATKTARDPKLISSTRPVYPGAARQADIQGSVTVLATIDENGKVVGARALSGPMLLRQAAVDSVKQWKYSPGLVDGKPAHSQATVAVEFRLN